jgi:hypothetical protein
MAKIDLSSVARTLGMKPSEVLDAEDTDAGLVVDIFDGTRLIIVPDDAPDADGKTGVMYLAAPISAGGKDYTGDAPVYAQPVEPAPDAPPAGDEEYPEKGSADDVLAWVAGDKDRAEFALEVENNGKARKGLTEELEAILAQYAGPDAPPAGDEENQ